ncbi:hypothetical protein CTA2_9808 [Colletotrichum tanaceti]|uniref:Uncharacterized protein n=1 Tax=Colletotrichum tanaceti TaxID=1306861 RepID=A0A4U6XFS3_9PEZI|nr:hypothetical protein CTA2_9808 [Colletotrichum tanaceti]TKW54718.1 hypothetical protein CTA1_5611 [Colletotrichum tanaceti]
MSANVNLIRGAGGRLYYQGTDGQWHLYPSSNYSNPSSYAANQRYSQDPNPPPNSTYPEDFEYDEERAEAGSFQGDPHEGNKEDARHASSSSSRRRDDDRVAEYVENQKMDRKHRDNPRDTTRISRRKKDTEKKIDHILKPFKR